MELELHKKFSMELEFVKLELHNNLEFTNSSFVNNCKSIHICQTVVLGHFGQDSLCESLAPQVKSLDGLATSPFMLR